MEDHRGVPTLFRFETGVRDRPPTPTHPSTTYLVATSEWRSTLRPQTVRSTQRRQSLSEVEGGLTGSGNGGDKRNTESEGGRGKGVGAKDDPGGQRGKERET